MAKSVGGPDETAQIEISVRETMAALDGDVVSAPMLYPVSGTPFGANFDPADIVLETWGTLTLDYSGCDTIAFGYNSTVAEFGSGAYNYVRLTTLTGTTCDL